MANKPQKVDIKYFDVSKPGKTTPDPTSRPTIVSQRTILKDPMVTTDEKETNEKPEDKKLAPSAPNLKLVPPDKTPEDQTENEKDQETKTTEDTNEKAEDKSEAKTEVKVSDTINDDQEPKAVSSTTDSGTAEEASENSGSPDAQAEVQKKADKQLQEETAKNQAIEKLVADKTYYAPIGEKKHRRSMLQGLIWTVVILILLALLGDLLIDSGTIKTSIKPPLSFFNNE